MRTEEKPRINNDQIDLECLRLLPQHTFGYAFVNFLDIHEYVLYVFWKPVQYVDDVELAYVMTHFHKIHDFGHVRFAVLSTIMGEVIYKRIEHAHTAFPVTTVAMSNWYFKLQPAEGCLAATSIIPWAKRAGKNASVPMTVAHEEEWETPLDELRARLNIEVASPFPSTTTTV